MVRSGQQLLPEQPGAGWALARCKPDGIHRLTSALATGEGRILDFLLLFARHQHCLGPI